MPLDRQTVIDDIRASNPELFEDWTDESIFSYAKQEYPDLNKLNVSPGKSAYESLGASEAPGFTERMGMQFETQIRETKTGIYGLLPWTETEAYENQRTYNNRLYQDKIANNPSLQALTAWKEDEPGWTNLHTAQRSLSEALPSLAISMVTTAAAVGLAKVTGGGSLVAATASLAPMFAMEAGGQMNEAMSVLEETGLSPEEARPYAQLTAVGYGAVSSIFERVGAKHYLSLFGLGKETSERLLKKSIAQRIVDTGVNSNTIARAGIRGSAALAKTLEGALMEGSTETLQAYMQNTINRGLELNLGEDQLSIQEAANKAFKETWNNPQVWEEGFAGATTGIIGASGFFTSKTTSADIDKRFQEPPKTKARQDAVKTPDVKEDDAILTKYFDAISNPEDIEALSNITDEIESGSYKGSGDVDAIKKAELTRTKTIGAKILNIITGNKDRVKSIEESSNKKFLVAEVFEEIKKSQKEKTFKEKLTTDEKLKVIKDFVSKGEISLEPESDAAIGRYGKPVIDYDPNKSNLGDIIVDRGKPVGGIDDADFDPNTLDSPGSIKAKSDYVKEVGRKADESKVGEVFTLPENLKSKNIGLNKLAGKTVKVSKITDKQKYKLKDTKGNTVAFVTPGELDSLGIDQEVKVKKTPKEQVKLSPDQQFLEEELTRRLNIEGEGLSLDERIELEDSIRKELESKLSPTPITVESLKKNKIPQLRAIAKEKGINLPSKIKKAEIIKAIIENDSKSSSPPILPKNLTEAIVFPDEVQDTIKDDESSDLSKIEKALTSFPVSDNDKKRLKDLKSDPVKYLKAEVEKWKGFIKNEDLDKRELKQARKNLYQHQNALSEAIKIDIAKGKTENKIAIKKLTEVLDDAQKPLTKAENNFIKKYEDNENRLEFSGALEEQDQVAAKKLMKEAGYKKPTKKSTAKYEKLVAKQIALAPTPTTTPVKTKIPKEQAEDIKGLITSEEQQVNEKSPTSTKFNIKQAVDYVLGERSKGSKEEISHNEFVIEAGKERDRLVKKYKKEWDKIKKSTNDPNRADANIVSKYYNELSNPAKQYFDKLSPGMEQETEMERGAYYYGRHPEDGEIHGSNLYGLDLQLDNWIFFNPVPITSDKKQETSTDVTKDDLDAIFEERQSQTSNESEADSNESDFQEKDSSILPYLKDEPEFVERLINRLKQHFPNIKTSTFEGLIIENGIEIIGQAMEGMITWSTTDGRLDTIPHEYAHIYVKMFREEPIIKKGINLFEDGKGNGEENLVLAIGKYYVNRMKNEPKSSILKLKTWLPKFIHMMKRWFGFGLKDKQEIMQFIAEEMYQGKWLGVALDPTFPSGKNNMVNEVDTEENSEFDDDSRNEETGGNLNKTNAMSSDDVYHSFYHSVFGITLHKQKDYPYIKKLELEKETKDFDIYLDKLYERLNKIVSNRNWESDNLKKREDLTPDELMVLRREWTKGAQLLKRYNSKAKITGKATRLYFRIISNFNLKTGKAKKSELRMEVADEVDRVNSSLFPSNVTANSVERDYINGDINIKLGFLPIKQIIRRVKTKASEFFVSSNKKIDLESLKEMQALNEQRYNSRLEEKILKIQKSIKETDSLEDIASKLKELIVQTITINGTKFGDNSAIISTLMQENNPHEITPDKFKKLIDKELEIGNINQKHYDLMMKQSYYNTLSNTDNDFINFSLSDYIDTWVKENPNGEINDLFKILTEKDKKGNTLSVKYTSYKHALSNQLHQLRFWQSIRTPDYFRYEKSAADSMIRLSIDLAEGARPRNLRDLKLMIIPSTYKVSGRIPKRNSKGEIVTDDNDKVVFIQSDPIPYDLFDGGSINGTQWLKELGENIGYKPFQQIKTFIRDRSINKDGSVDYLGMKHMQFAGFKDMVITNEKGNVVAKMVQDKNTKLTNWVAINKDGTDGQKFDQISSPNEAKMTYGKYASLNQKKKAYPNDKTKHQEGYGVVHSIKSSSIVVNQVQQKSKMDASFPIPLGELMLGVPASKETKAVLSRIRARYAESVKHYTDTINKLYNDPKELYKFVKRSKDEGDIISELEQYIEDIGVDGYGLQHPAIMTHLIPSINNKIIKNGLNKGRSTNKIASTLYIKPSFSGVTQKTNNQHVLKDHVILSSDNKIAFNYVLKKFKEFSSENKKIIEDTNIKNPKAKHTLINTYLNPFLEANEINVLLHRNPISKVTNPVVRRVQSIEEGHGESMLLTNDDVKKIFDGDWDGDKGVFEFISKEFSDDMKIWEQYSKDQKISGVVSLPIFGARIDSGKSKEQSTALSSADHSFNEKDNSSDVLKEISRNALNSGTTGIAMNGRTILNQLFSKNLEIQTKIKTAGESKDGLITIANLNSKVVLNYIAIDKEMMNQEEINTLEENGDTLVDENGKDVALDQKVISSFEGDLYLKTTKSHEMAILFQMAVDGSKFTHLADILKNSDQETFMDFMMTRMFQKKLANGTLLKSKFTEEEIGLLKQVYDAQNYSKQRGGRTRTGISATMDMNIDFSSELNKMINGDNSIGETTLNKELLKDSPKGLKSDALYSQEFKNKMAKRILELGKSYNGIATDKFNITLENNITPMESLLIGLDNNLNKNYINQFKNKHLRDMSHVSAMQDVIESKSVSEFMDKMQFDPNMQEIYNNAENFLREKTPYIEIGSGKLSEILTGSKKAKQTNYSFIDIWKKLMEQTEGKEQIQADKNLMFAEFIDRFLPKYENLTSDEKKWVTIRFLSGNLFKDEIYVQKLLPKVFLDNSIMKTYLKSWENKMRNDFIKESPTKEDMDKLKNTFAITPQQQRIKRSGQGGFNYQKEQIIEQRESSFNQWSKIKEKVCV